MGFKPACLPNADPKFALPKGVRIAIVSKHFCMVRSLKSFFFHFYLKKKQKTNNYRYRHTQSMFQKETGNNLRLLYNKYFPFEIAFVKTDPFVMTIAQGYKKEKKRRGKLVNSPLIIHFVCLLK